MTTENILSFLADNYKYFMIAAGVLLVALIGFYFDGKKKKKASEEGIQQAPQGGFTQDASMNMVQNSVEPTVMAPNQAPEVSSLPNGEPAPVAPTSDTIFTAPPVNGGENASEDKLIIEEPQTALNSNAGIETMISEAPSVPETPVVEAPAAPTIEINPAPAETVIEASPTMQAPQVESPVSMVQEEPVMQSVQPEVATPEVAQPTQPTQTYQNTIQQ